ncbi:glycosyltransferase [Paucilactobacillus suebicus]|uniref:Poly(Glycerol-phosphate) alpha-glucosyltransferase n=1 Tax=Paucilactobacillus suebicus DSM 5007 = KCTC 3549 TaxID=1423807 RepID=A0A0R1W5K7_9LACO|nr:glycosyltransferase [Paucilactobacillus suebicus]KRM09868.1 poly(glycerol-phosphate) alpha-glucosyltransferase [Paucilactobacillus suebicus DSM 5007 = KCTC 3549]
MIYFLNDNIQDKKSGIEHAQIKRLNLFNQFKVPAKIVTRQSSTSLHTVTNAAGIDDSQLINLFDYFQETMDFETKKIRIQNLKINSDWKREPEGDSYNYYRNNNRIMYVHRDSDKRVTNAQYFDHFGKLLKVEWYDDRGFISIEHVYDWTSKIATENFMRPDGSIAIQKSRLLDKRGKEVESYHLFNYKGQDYQFANFDELTSFFYDQLVIDGDINDGQYPVFIVDRSYELGWAVLHMQNPVYKAFQLHNSHLNDVNDLMNSSLNYNYAYGLNHFDNWDAVISLTSQQDADMKVRYNTDHTKLFQIPGPIVPKKTLEATHVDFKKRKPYSVIMVARLSPEKQQDHLVRAWKKIHEKLPQATLDLWGYENGEFGKQIKQQVDDAKLSNSIKFRGYTTDIAQVYDEAQLTVLPSRSEGLPLALVEAQSHGMPIVANDIKYGPADVVVDGKDGYLTKNGDVDGLADAIIKALSDQDQLAKFSEQAYIDSARYSEENVMKKWQVLLDDVKEEH